MRFENVWLRYDRRSSWVLQAVDVTLDAGQVAVVVGRDGAGKSTLLSAAAGLLRPERGRIIDRPVRVGWVPERFPADQPFTIGAYLVGMARAHGLSRAAAMEQVDLWAERLYLGRYLDSTLAELSKGTAQKVGLIQALIPRPDLLVLDEPWEGLDAQTRDLVPDLVGEILAVGGSVLISDHLGDTARLPGALRWHVEGGKVDHYQVAAVDHARFVIEVGVAARDVPETVAELRGLGHEVLRVRPPRGVEVAAGPAADRRPAAGREVAPYQPTRAPSRVPTRADSLTSRVPDVLAAWSADGPGTGTGDTLARAGDPAPAPGADIPWHGTVGTDARRGEVARHGASRHERGRTGGGSVRVGDGGDANERVGDGGDANERRQGDDGTLFGWELRRR